MKKLLLTALLLSIAGCKKDAPSPPLSEKAGAAPAPAGATAKLTSDGGRLEPELPKSSLTLTRAELDSYVVYQRRRQELFGELMGELGKMQARADAGRYEGMAGNAGAMKDVVALSEKQAEAEEQARNESGMGADKLEQVEDLVSAIVSKRMVAKPLNQEQLISDMEKMKANVPAESAKEFEESIAQMKAQAAELKNLTEERKRYGDGNVDLVLAREADLISDYEKWLGMAAAKK